MSSIGRFVVNKASAAMSALRNNNETNRGLKDSLGTNADSPRLSTDIDSPRLSDVIEVKNMLLKAYALPLDIVDAIVDYAEYWPHTTMSTKEPSWARACPRFPSPGTSEDRFVLRSLPLGYPPRGTENDQFVAINDYFNPTRQPNPCHTRSLRTGQPTTESILKIWASQSLPRGKSPCRKIVFTIKSKDQGWGGDPIHKGTYYGSFTWFDAGIERFEAVDTNRPEDTKETPSRQFQPQFQVRKKDSTIPCDIYTILPGTKEEPVGSSRFVFNHPFLPSHARIQSNVTAGEEIKEHIITWSYNDCIDPESPEGDELERQGRGRASATGKLVRNLQIGDIITVWARARFSGWSNRAEEVRIDIYWAV